MKTQQFSYTASIRLADDGETSKGISIGIPNVANLNVASRVFPDYNECVLSCKTLMDDMKTRFNAGVPDEPFSLKSEINPIHTGTPTVSKDWEPMEVARMWIFDKAVEGSPAIVAVGQARIWTAFGEPGSTLN